MIRVAVIDDHPIVREGLVAALRDRDGIEISGVFATADEAIARLRADVAVLDLELPGMSGLDAIAPLAARAAVLVLTAYANDEQIERALDAGARGYLLKGSPLDQIDLAIRTVARGESYLDPRVASRVLAIARQPRLSARESEVLRLIAAGKSNKEIGAALGVAERTVKFHVTSVLNKLGAENRAQAVALAVQRGLVSSRA